MIEAILLGCVAGLGACGADTLPAEQTPVAAEPLPRVAVFHNGVVHSLDESNSTHEALARTPAVDEQTYQGLLFGLGRLARNGITSIADARVYWTRGYHEIYLRAEQEKSLTARVVMGLWAYPQMDDATQLDTLAGLFNDDPRRLVRASQVKVYSDGITQNTTARSLDPYLVDYGFETPFGLNYFSEDRLTAYIATLEPLGTDIDTLALPVRSLLDAGALLTLSSDFDVSSLNPFVGVHNAVNRSDEALTLDEALRAYTINAAYLMRQEHRTGTVEVGKRADFKANQRRER